MKIPKETILNIERQIRREEYKQNGGYDGRNAPRITTDKKRQKNKNKCRERIDYNE